jgi:pimeloyl-ACP methyl ester carboxylesterase
MATPGILYVTMQPKPGLSLDQFHEWYNNEHGPTRLRIPDIFTNGLRYRESDGKEPTFLASYDVTSMSHLETPTYTVLRANRSPREAETIGQVVVKRCFFDLVLTKQSPLFLPIEQLADNEAEGIELVAVQNTLKEIEGAEEDYKKWYEEEHMEVLSKVPGWLRTRWFKTSSIERGVPMTYLALHEYAKGNGLGGPEHQAAMSTSWREQVANKYVGTKTRRTYRLFYVFGPAPRDISSLSRLPHSTPVFVAADRKTSTFPGPQAVIKSYVSTSDALSIAYQLEGSPASDAPTIAFCNSLLTSLHMWDPLVSILKKNRPDVRILRYDARGRHSIPHPPTPATPDILAADLCSLLDALRIPKLDALIGVSMGGVTTLNFALNFPDRLDKFVACDFNTNSSASNTQAWKDRIVIAEEGSGTGIKTKLAAQTVSRWFHPKSMEKPEVVEWITDMVASNDVEGFRYSCQALWDYDLKGRMGECCVPGLFVVGDGDAKGALVKAMDGFKALLGEKGAELRIVPNAGHLPMCEEPEAFWEAVCAFL